MKTIAQLTTAEMVAEYNTLTGKSIKKFSSRAVGDSQLAKARAEASTTEHTQDGKIYKMRARRDNVAVEGVGTFLSVHEAFKKLNLPLSLNQHIKFIVMALKQDGSCAFGTGDKKYHFKLVEAK